MSKRILIIVTNPAPAPLLWENFQREYKGSPINDDNIKSIDVGSCDKIYLIKQQDRKINTDELLNNVINHSGSDVSIIIAYHKESISTDTFNKFILIPFHHDNEEEIYRDYLCPLSIRKKDFDVIWDDLLIGKSNYLNRIRSEILTPFIPFHLFYQLKPSGNQKDEWNGILTECIANIKKMKDEEIPNNPLKKLLKNISQEMGNNVESAFNSLMKYFPFCDTSGIDEQNANNEIKKFATCLENIINSIESKREVNVSKQ